MHDFLSEAWIDAVRAIRDEYAEHITSTPPPMRMNIVVKEVPFGEGTSQAHIDTTTGEMAIEVGHLESPDLTVTVDYTVAKALFVQQDQAAAMQAFMAGKIQVQGDMTKMMAMQTAGAPSEKEKEMAEKIKDVTNG